MCSGSLTHSPARAAWCGSNCPRVRLCCTLHAARHFLWRLQPIFYAHPQMFSNNKAMVGRRVMCLFLPTPFASSCQVGPVTSHAVVPAALPCPATPWRALLVDCFPSCCRSNTPVAKLRALRPRKRMPIVPVYWVFLHCSLQFSWSNDAQKIGLREPYGGQGVQNPKCAIA